MGGRFQEHMIWRCCDQFAALSNGLTISATGISAISQPGASCARSRPGASSNRIQNLNFSVMVCLLLALI